MKKKTPMQIRTQALEDSLKLVTKLAVRKTTSETELAIVSSYESRAQEIADKYDAFIIEAREILGIEVHKCKACGREESVCSANPCEAVLKERSE